MRYQTAARRCSQGFTLVEMLVAMGIALVLATLVVAFLPNVAHYQRTSQGAGQLQSWLLIAKQRAKRDGFPRGVRLIKVVNPADATDIKVSELRFIEQPEDLFGGTLSTQASPTNQVTIAGSGTPDLSGGFDGTRKGALARSGR